jgi:hypothetical protein
MKTELKIGDTVQHRHRRTVGKITYIHAGCNPIYEVDFGKEFISMNAAQDIRRLI